jgi:hypothetical protein
MSIESGGERDEFAALFLRATPELPAGIEQELYAHTFDPASAAAEHLLPPSSDPGDPLEPHDSGDVVAHEHDPQTDDFGDSGTHWYVDDPDDTDPAHHDLWHPDGDE